MTAIEWTDAGDHAITMRMAQTKEGARKIAAKKAGVSVPEYARRVDRGLKWCFGCSQWQAIALFGKDVTRYDGLSASCLQFKRVKVRRIMVLKRPSVKEGNRATEAVRRAIKLGALSRPSTRKCSRCTKRASAYHHYKGYDPHNHLAVEPLCCSCHSRAHWDG